MVVGIGKRYPASLQWRWLFRLGETSPIVALLISLVQLCLREVLLIDQVVKHFRERGEAFLYFLNLAIKYAVDNLVQIIKDSLESLTILFLKDDLGLAVTHFPLPVQLVQVETIGIRTLVTPQEVGTIFGGTE